MRPLELAYLGQLWMRTALREHRRWRQPAPAERGVRVFYGFERLPSRGEPAFGGIVKIQDLQGRFPNTAQGPNILYLVSSFLPDFAVRMAALAKKRGVKVVVNQNGVAYPGWCRDGWKAINRPRKRLLGVADHVFYQSRFCREASDRFLRTRKRGAEILYNPVDTERFRPAAEGDGGRGVRLLLAGSHQSFYRVEVAVKAFRAVAGDVPGSRLVIAGRYTWRRDEKRALGEARQLIERLGVGERVELRGAYTQMEAPAMLRGAHLLIHSKYNDPCPRLVVEAMACGLPVVYSATGGVPELVGEAAGVGVPGPTDWERDHPPDPEAMADAILRVLAARERYARAARARAVKRFDVRPWVARHEAVFQSLLKK